MKSRLRIIAITVFCLTSIYAGAQSQRKINEQLNAELAMFKSKYDSVMVLESKAASRLLIKQTDFAAAQLRNAQRQGTNLTDALAKVEKPYNQLLRLEKEPTKLVNLNDLKREIVRFQEKLPGAELPPKMMEQQKIVLLKDSILMEKRNRKAQNEWLRGQLSQYSKAIEENKTKILEMDAYSEVIDRTRPILDSIYLNYEQVLYDLAVGEAVLKDSINRLLEFSLTNWPKNFSPPFEREFGTPERQEISQPTGEGWSTHVWYTYKGYPFIESESNFIQYANPIPIHEFSVGVMRNQGQVNMFKPDPSIVYSYVDEQAEFPGGSGALMQYIRNNFRIPQVVEDLGLSFKLRMKFTVLEDGSITDITVSKGIAECPECDKEALRVIKNMPKWKPGKLQGKVVKSWYSLPIQIHLD